MTSWRRVDGMVAGAAGEPSAKRAKVDEAKEEEDPLVRRREELVRLLEKASAKGKGNARAKKELLALCADFEAKNDKLLGRLLPELWQKIVDEYLDQNDMLAFAMTCRFFREKQKDLGKKMVTTTPPPRRWYIYHLLDLRTSGRMPSHSMGWFQWVCATFEILPGYKRGWKRVKGTVYEGDLVNYAALQGSVEILRWLMEEKGWEPNMYTGRRAGRGGSVKVLEYLVDRGYEFDREVCNGAAIGGHLEALKFLRGLDPPCPWDEWDYCTQAAEGGHLDVLKWFRSQNPPCPWTERTCAEAARKGHLDVLVWLRAQEPPCPWGEWTCNAAAEAGHLEVLKWARSQNPPCPWDHSTCYGAAGGGHLEVLKWARDQDPPCPWDVSTCAQAARNGHLEVLKWARDQDPPCPWDWRTTEDAAGEGRLRVLKWVRSQDPPCPWSEGACAQAAENGQLEVLKWLRDQDPPCPWGRRYCKALATGSEDPYEITPHHQHIIDWIDQQEDWSDCDSEYYIGRFDVRYLE